jgi:methylmalonyl-CoA mutase C-terminal domain/subunit
MEDVLVITGGVIPMADIQKLKAMGAHGVFPPGSKLEDIVQFIRDHSRFVADN